jgi:short-subunit dehydrogenase
MTSTGAAGVAHAVITGAAGAIGSAIARAIRARYPDAALTLADVDAPRAEALAREIDPADAAAWDLSRPDTLAGAFEAAVARRGPVDALVSCAGIMEMRTLAGTPWALGARLLDVDLVSPLRLMSLAAPSMIERGRGLVVNVSSMAGVTPLRGCTFYGGAKAGLAMASEVARLELLPHGVQVITVYPGPVRSALEQRARAQLPPALLARAMPTGDAEALAALVMRAWARGEARVVYPSLYDIVHRVPRLAGWFTSLFSPTPHA